MRMLSSTDAGMTYGLCSGQSVTVCLESNSSNAYFTTDRVPQLNTRGGMFDAKPFSVITNWATFGEQNNSLKEYNADFDFILDTESNNKGKKL